ncbi:hypothetical protein H0H92_013390 [Tricholoma furcatifolium]|nr:hypothetical protein H0H92_013390 [Tricholoma furcatifolium]
MVDAVHLFKSPPHIFEPWKQRDFSGRSTVVASRTLKPVRYYVIDFGISRQYLPGITPRLELPPWGGDDSVPEHSSPNAPACDPFPVDVYCLGNYIRRFFLVRTYVSILNMALTYTPSCKGHRKARKRGLEFMHELVADMTSSDPLKRPTMKEVVARYDVIYRGLSDWKLRSPVVIDNERYTTWMKIKHWTRQLKYRAHGIPAIPKA